MTNNPITAMPARPAIAAIDGATQLLFMVGDPIAQVKAPQRLNPLLASRGLNAVMLPLEASACDFDATVRALMQVRNVRGFVFTVPHKFAAARLADELGPEAEACGAINAMVRRGDGCWHGDMFDGQGFVAGLVESGHAVNDVDALLVGAGGAGVAIAAALLAAGAAAISVFDVDPARAQALVASLARRDGAGRLRIANRAAAAQGHRLVVNATPLGMKADDPAPIDLAALSPDAVVAEAIMSNAPTALLREAAARGNPVIPGHRMLEGQMEALERFLLQAFDGIPSSVPGVLSPE